MDEREGALGEAGGEEGEPLGLALRFLLAAADWPAARLAKATGRARKTIAKYQKGRTLTRERLEELAAAMDLGPAAVEEALLAAQVCRPRPGGSRSPVDPGRGQLEALARAAARVGREGVEATWAAGLRQIREDNRRRALEQGERLAGKLKDLSPEEQRAVIAASPTYRTWGLAYVLAAQSETMTPREPEAALQLAELALFVARLLPEDGFKPRMVGWCQSFVGNALRVLGRDMAAAGREFDEANRCWCEGSDPEGLLSEAYRLDMEASLRRDQRDFPRALELHKKALVLARPEEKGAILLNTAGIYQQQCEHEKALAVLDEAACAAEGGGRPREIFGIIFNRAANLIRLDRALEAAPLVEKVQELVEKQGNAVDRLRALWLEANCSAGLGFDEKAVQGLEVVRQRFEEWRNPYNYALASLDQALIYRELGRCQEIKLLADEILEIFRAQRVHREALMAVRLFREAAERKAVTIGLVRQLQDYLVQAKKNPRLKFSPGGKE